MAKQKIHYHNTNQKYQLMKMKQIKSNSSAVNVDLQRTFLFTISHGKNNHAIHIKDHTSDK